MKNEDLQMNSRMYKLVFTSIFLCFWLISVIISVSPEWNFIIVYNESLSALSRTDFNNQLNHRFLYRYISITLPYCLLIIQ